MTYRIQVPACRQQTVLRLTTRHNAVSSWTLSMPPPVMRSRPTLCRPHAWVCVLLDAWRAKDAGFGGRCLNNPKSVTRQSGSMNSTAELRVAQPQAYEKPASDEGKPGTEPGIV